MAPLPPWLRIWGDCQVTTQPFLDSVLFCYTNEDETDIHIVLFICIVFSWFLNVQKWSIIQKWTGKYSRTTRCFSRIKDITSFDSKFKDSPWRSRTSGNLRQQSQQLAGEAAVPYSVVGCCEVDKHSSGLIFSRKTILDVLRQQGDLVYGRPPVSKARLLLREQWVYDWVDTSVDESLEDFNGNTQQRYGTTALWVPQWLFCIGIAAISALLQIFGILSWSMQELRKSQNQDFRADPAWVQQQAPPA